MQFKEFLNTFPNLSLATEADYPSIESLAKQIPMGFGEISLYYSYPNGLKDFLKLQAEQSFIVLIRDTAEQLKGFVLLSKRILQFKDKNALYVYLSDMRIQSDIAKEIKLQWRECFAQLCGYYSKIDEFKDCSGFYCAILNGNKKAEKALLDSRNPFQFQQWYQYQTSSFLAPKPLRSLFRSSKWQRISKEQYASIHFSNAYQPDIVSRQDYESDKSYYFMYYSQGRLLGKAKFSSPSKWRKLVITQMGNKLKFISPLLGILGIKKLKEGIELKSLYANELEFTHDFDPKQLNSSIENLVLSMFRIKSIRNFHSIVIPYFDPKWKKFHFLQNSSAQIYNINKDIDVDSSFIDLSML